MDHDTSSNDLWTMDRISLNPGLAVDLLNRRSIRETELLRKISDMTDELRATKSVHKLAAPEIVAPKVRTVEDYAIAALPALIAFEGPINDKMTFTVKEHADMAFSFGDAMVAQAERRRS